MAINRFYQPAEQTIHNRWFQPNVDVLAQTLQSAQTQQDQAKAMLAKVGETQFNFLEADRPYATKALGEIDAQIDQFSRGAMGDGDLRSVRGDIDTFARDTARRFRQEGDIGSMVANYEAFQKYSQGLEDLVGKEVGKGGISREQADALRSVTLGRYGQQQGIGEGGPQGYQGIGTIGAAAAVNIDELIEKYGKGYIPDSIEGARLDSNGNIVPGAMWRDSGKVWRKTTYGREEVRPSEVREDLLGAILRDPKYGEYLNQMKELGLSNYGMEDLFLRDEFGNLLEDEAGQLIVDRNHPVAGAVDRGASKFGFLKESFDDDIKFDPYDLEDYKSRLRQQEENYKGLMMNYKSTTKQDTLSVDELKENAGALSEVIKTQEGYLQKLNKELNAAGSEEERNAIRSEMASVEMELNNKRVQRNNATNTIKQLSKQGGFDIDKAWEEYKEGMGHQNTDFIGGHSMPNMTREEFTNIVLGDGQIPRNFVVVGEDKTMEDNTMRFFSDLVNQAKYASIKGATMGLKKTRNVLLADNNTTTGKYNKLIVNGLQNGSLNFITEEGLTFSNNEFNTMVASGDVAVENITDPINGMPGFAMTVTDKDGNKKTHFGVIPGLENTTYVNDIIVDLRMRSTNPGISVNKANSLNSLANMFEGMSATATEVGHDGRIINTGHGSIGSQVYSMNLETSDTGDLSPMIKGPKGMSFQLETRKFRNGRNVYFPRIYKNGIAMSRKEAVETYGMAEGGYSIEDFLAFIGSQPGLRTQQNK